jgi:hypothetical protein
LESVKPSIETFTEKSAKKMGGDRENKGKMADWIGWIWMDRLKGRLKGGRCFLECFFPPFSSLIHPNPHNPLPTAEIRAMGPFHFSWPLIYFLYIVVGGTNGEGRSRWQT